MKQRKKTWKVIFMFVVLFVCIWMAMVPGGVAHASSDVIEVYTNGVSLRSDVEPFIRDDRTYVPLRAISEALGSDVSYEEDSQTAIIINGGVEIRMPVDSTTATVNGRPMEIPAPAVLVQERIMVPLRFVSETLDSHVTWTDGYEDGPGIVRVYSSYATKTESGIGISSKRFVLEEEVGERYTMGSSYFVPQFEGMSDRAFQNELNMNFQNMISGLKKWITEHYIFDSEEDLNKISAIEDSKEWAEAIYQAVMEENEYFYSVYDDCDYELISEGNAILTVGLRGYTYMGGAHGMPYFDCYTLDLNRNRRLTLKDLFADGVDYESILLNEMEKIRSKDIENFEEVENVTEIDGTTTDFYFKDRNLVLYYRPYHLSSYARGFVEFPIPINSIADDLAIE